MRNYKAIDLSVRLIQESVEHGFDGWNSSYEFFASEGMQGDPEDLPDDEFLELEKDLLDQAKDALDFLSSKV